MSDPATPVPAAPAAPSTDDPRARLANRILSDAPRLGPDDTFTFACHPGVSCFTECCADVNIFLSPYDVLRMKRRLGMSSREFLETYTLLPVQKEMTTPVVMLRMGEGEGKPCPFVGAEGCGIYADRPWPCRMYPLGLAAQKDAPDGAPGERFCFLLREAACRGFDDGRAWTVRQWFDDQHIDEYDRWGDAFKELTLHPFFAGGGVLPPEKLHMFYTACYDLDTFREFVFGSTLLQRFDVDEDLVAEMRYDDEALLRFGFLWLRFSLFGEPTMRPRPEVLEAFEKRELFRRRAAEVAAAMNEGGR
jgi:Fe-S-cluster containining protein